MAVDKAMIPSDIQMMDDETPDMELDIEAITDEPIEITLDDGSIEVDFGDTPLEAWTPTVRTTIRRQPSQYIRRRRPRRAYASDLVWMRLPQTVGRVKNGRWPILRV
jgi:hypothetical protein